MIEGAFDPRVIGIPLTTMYPNWQPVETRGSQPTVDNVRGDLALQTCLLSAGLGYQVLVLDSRSSDGFKSAVHSISGVTLSERRNPSMSGGRRQGFEEISHVPGVQVICHLEPEKAPLVPHIQIAVQPILHGEADIVIPKRDEKLFAQTYPGYQVSSERRFNRIWNAVMRSHISRFPQDVDFDGAFGPKFFLNKPEVLELFLREYMFQGPDTPLYRKLAANIDVWPNAIFLPITEAFYQRLRVASVTVPYEHPKQQTAIESVGAETPEFGKKRKDQFDVIISATNHLIRTHEGNAKGRLVRAVRQQST